MGKLWDAFNHRRLLQIRNNRTDFFLNRIFGGFVAEVAALFESMGQTDSYTKKILKQSYSYQRQQSHFCTVRQKLGEIKLAVVDAKKGVFLNRPLVLIPLPLTIGFQG